MFQHYIGLADCIFFQERHKTYKRKILELEEIQHTLSREIQAETQLLGDITSNVNRLCAVVDLKLPDSKTLPPPEGATQQLESLKEQIKDKERLLEEVKLWLPKKVNQQITRPSETLHYVRLTQSGTSLVRAL